MASAPYRQTRRTHGTCSLKTLAVTREQRVRAQRHVGAVAKPRDDIPMSLLLGGGGFHTMSGCSVWGGVWESECNRLLAVDETGV